MMEYKPTDILGGGEGTNSMNLQNQMASQRRRDTSPSNNGTNELIANLDHELLDVRVRAVKCLLRKLECGIVSSESLKDRVDLLDRCRRWLSKVQETQKSTEVVDSGNNNSQIATDELEGVEVVIQLLFILSKHKEFRDLLRKANVDGLLLKLQPFISGDFKYQLDAIVSSVVVGQYELSYQGAPSEWFDNNTCPALASSRTSEMYSNLQQKPFSYKTYADDHRSPPRLAGDESGSSRNTPEASLPKKSGIPIGSEDGWIEKIPFFVPFVQLNGTDKRVIHSTVESLSATNDSLVLMTVSFVRDTLTMDYPPEFFIQESSLLLALAQVTVSRWTDRKIPYIAIQTLSKISSHLRFRLTQLNFSEHYETPTNNPDQRASSMYDYYDSYSSRLTPKASTSTPTSTDALAENFIQLFKNFARSLLYASYDQHLWPVFESFAFTLLKCVSIFPVDSKALTLSLQGILMELAHIWERKSDFQTTVGLCLISGSILNSMKIHNETFIVSKDVRNMLRSLSYSPIIRNGWPEVFEHFVQFASMFDPSAGILSDQPKNNSDEENTENHPKNKILKLLYTIQNASSHEEVLDSVDSLRDVLLPITLNIRLGQDSLSYILQDVPWRDTFYRFLCVEPTTEGDEELLARVLDLFTFILQNVLNASTFKWITPLCCEKSCTTLKLLGNTASKQTMAYGGTALPDLFRSLLSFYEVILKHGKVLISDNVKWEIFQIYTAILHSLEHTSYSNFALLTAISKDLGSVSAEASVQAKIKDNPIACVAVIHRITDAVMILEANGSLFDGYKNSCSLYYLSICLVHMLVAVMKEENYKKFKGDWVERCGRAFHIFEMSPDSRVKSQAFQIAEILSSATETKIIFAESSFKDSLVSLLELSYSTFVDQKYPATVKFRAGNVILNLLRDEDEKTRFSLVKRLQQAFSVLVDVSQMSSRVLWNSKLSAVVKNSKTSEKAYEPAVNTGVLFVTPRVLTVLSKILITFIKTLVESNERENTLHEVMSSGIAQMMFRIVLRNPLKTETNFRAWLDCCVALSSVFESLINVSKLDRSISVILIGEKRCLSLMLGLLEVVIPSSSKGANQEKAEAVLNTLFGNILNLATILCCDAGNNFEDLERVVWSHQQVIFTKLADWLKITTPAVSRRAALCFSHGFLSVLSHRKKQEVVDTVEQSPVPHPFLCRNWKDDITYGQALSEDLINIFKNSVDNAERISATKCLAALFSLSSSSVKYAVKNVDIVNFCVKKIHSFGCKYFEAKGTSLSNRKVTTALHSETLAFMELLSSLFYVSADAKAVALKCNFPDILHKIFGWWTTFPDSKLLHAYVEALLNFTEEFPEGALALIMTSNVVGVGPRRVPTQQSIFMEILGILEKELASVESNPNLKTIEIIFELLKNICFVQECRNILLKSPVILFIRRLHSQETKKWGSKQNAVKINYLDFLVHATAHSDVQTCIAKIPEGLEILVQLIEVDHPPASTLSLKVLRNLCFQPSNRGRLLSENLFIPSLSNKLLMSTDLEEIENASISLWALIANYEKGRLNAKKSYCGESIMKALERIRKMEQTSNSGDLSRLISLLETVQNVLGTTSNFGGSKAMINSRASSVSQV